GLPLLGQGNRIIEALANCDLKVKGITFQNGRQIGYLPGGAIFFAGNKLEVDSCRFIDNQAGSCGGAIGARAQTVIVKNSYFQGDNILGGGARGAAIMQCGPATGTIRGTLSVQNCAFYNCTTQTHGYSYVIAIYDSSLSNEGGGYSNTGKIDVTNCTFSENSSVTTYQAAIDVSDGDCDVYLVNNTFYKNSECAFRLMSNKAFLANNVIVGARQGIMTDYKVADGRTPMVAMNNIVVGTEGGINGGIDDACFTSAAATNNNTISTTAAYPLTKTALASSLSTDNFVPYLPITSTSSTLIDAGTDNVLAQFGANYVLTTDTRGLLANNKKDIGAYEYLALTGISFPTYVSENYQVSLSENTLTVKNRSEKSFTLTVVNVAGKTVCSTRVASSVELDKSRFGKGVFILLLTDGTETGSRKVVF
ncbi:MAG TPA: T9SS type A sorting domain-containing protein, partial [Paludibacter sp.]